MQTNPTSSCTEALAPVLQWDFASFRGLPACSRNQFDATLGAVPLPGEGQSRLGMPGKTHPFIVVPMAGTPRGAKIWLDGEMAWSISLNNFSTTKNTAALLL